MSDQTLEEKYPWIPFYEAMADRLLDYQDKKGELLELTNGALKESGLNPVKDVTIDPFRVMQIFNAKGEPSSPKRKEIAAQLQHSLDLKNINLPDIFSSATIQTGNNKNITKESSNSRWVLFSNAITFSNSTTDDSVKSNFIKSFDDATSMPGNGLSITTLLHWIRPTFFLDFQRDTSKYYTTELKIQTIYVSNRIQPNEKWGDRYLRLIDQLNTEFEKFKKDNSALPKSFPELSAAVRLWATNQGKPSSGNGGQTKNAEGVQPKANVTPTTKMNDDTVETNPPNYTVRKFEYRVKSIKDDDCFHGEKQLNEMLVTLKRKKNIILQGPPGTGKTWLAKRLAYALIGEVYEKDGEADKKYKYHPNLRTVQFHPNMSYEDFVLGYRPTGNSGELKLVDGPFIKIVEEALEATGVPFVMVIEEINRGNPAQIFGELLTLLEASKRSKSEELELSYGNKLLYIPDNVYVIGTMNIADRSLALVDLALRRRFSFFDLKPNFDTDWETWLTKCDIKLDTIKAIGDKMKALNKTIAEDNNLGEQFCIGHSFVTPDPKELQGKDDKVHRDWFEHVVKFEIYPLLQEYWFGDNETKKNADKAKKELFDAVKPT